MNRFAHRVGAFHQSYQYLGRLLPYLRAPLVYGCE